MAAEVGSQPPHDPPVLQRSPDGLPYRSCRSQTVQQQGCATTIAASFVPNHAPGLKPLRGKGMTVNFELALPVLAGYSNIARGRFDRERLSGSASPRRPSGG